MRALRPVASDALYRWLGVFSVATALEVVSRAGLVSRRHFPPVSEMLVALADQLDTWAFWSAIGGTLGGWGVGLAISFALGVPLGILVGSSPKLYRSLRLVIEFLRPIPSVALIPLIVLVFGSGFESKVFLVAFASFWPLFIQAIYGVQDVDPIAMDTARSFGLGALQRFVRVSAPSAVPYIATGVRISSSTALILAVTAEIVIGAGGLGLSINKAREAGAITVMYALLVATGILGMALNALAGRIERSVLHWHPSHRAAEALA
jgi:ABC-type nitrate/sulfonate/bicarbonate transport system permease component